MIPADSPLLSGNLLLFLGNLAVLSVLLGALGAGAATWGRRLPLPWQHGVLAAIVCLCLCSPVLLALSMTWGLGVIRLPADAEAPRPPADAGHVAPQSIRSIPADVAATGAGGGGTLWQSLALAGTLLACVWAGGTAATVVYLLQALRRTSRFRRGLQGADDVELQETALQALRRLGCGRVVTVCESPYVVAPFSLGLLRPTIVLPEGLATELDAEQLQLVLLHEGAHICRRDHAMVLVQVVVAALFWWNPLLHAVNRHLAGRREQLCDDMAAQGEGRRRLAASLLQIAAWSVGRRQEILGAAGMVDDGPAELGERIERLLRPSTPASPRLGISATASLVALTGLFSAALMSFAPHVSPAGVDVPNSYENSGNAGQDVLAGHWVMYLPAGFQHRITLTPVGPNRYRLAPDRLNSSGVYELRGERLVLVQPTRCHIPGFEWEVRGGDRLVMVAQPPVDKIGSNYSGAYLSR